MPDFRVIIPSRDPMNVTACVKAVRQNEPDLPVDRIIVVDDGARNGANLPGITWVDGIKPFVFSRNVNLGMFTPIQGTYHDALVLNDDAELETPHGFSMLAQVAKEHPKYGIIGAAISGAIGNLRQRPQGTGLRLEPRMVCFIAVYIPLATLQMVGPLDERFTGYGFDDDDYCRRVREAGKLIGVFDGCIVRHGRLPSSYRRSGNCPLAPNQAIYEQKWGPMETWR